MRLTIAGITPTAISRTDRNGHAAVETSASATRSSSSRARGPAIWKPTRERETLRTATPSAGNCASNQRM